MPAYLHCTQHLCVLPPLAGSLISLLGVKPAEDTSPLHLLPVPWERGVMSTTRVLLVNAPEAASIQGSGGKLHSMHKWITRPKMALSHSIHISYHFLAGSLQTGYFMSPHFSSC